MLRRAIALLLVAAVLAPGLMGCGRRRPPARIVLVVIDTLRRDHLSCYGGATATPNIDAFAAGGTRFTNAFSSFHQTTMSMATLFTGRTPSIESGVGEQPLPWTGKTWCGLARFAARDGDDACIPAAVPTLAAALQHAGWATIAIVSNPFLFRPAGYERGFDEWIQVRGEPDWAHLRQPANLPPKFAAEFIAVQRRTAAQVNEAVGEWLRRRQTDHFFLYVHYMDTHDWVPLGTRYEDGVAATDRAVGELRGMLAEQHLLEDAVVVLTADHGEALGEPHPLPTTPTHFGEPSFEQLVRVPLIVSPRVARDPDRFMRTDDTFHLLLQLAGIERDGAASDLQRDELFLTEQRFRTYRKGRWKSIWPRTEANPVLFDLETDPAEQTDIAAAHLDRVVEHGRRIEALANALAARGWRGGEAAPADRARLRALGYAD